MNAIPLLLSLPLALAPAAAPDRSPPTLEKALLDNAPRILDHLGRKHYRTLGVLKFRVQQGDDRPTDNAGPLNRLLADRLEAALVLTMKHDKVRLLRAATDTVARSRVRASHVTEPGRRALLRLDTYTPAWGKDEALRADALLTGTARFDADANSCEITVEAFDRTATLTKVCNFHVASDPRLLTEAGISYAIARGLKPEKTATKRSKEGRDESPLDFQIHYDGKPVTLDDGDAVEEPRPGQRVAFRLSHRDKDETTYGAVLRINGTSCIYPDKPQPEDFDAYKFVLKPTSELVIRGFVTGDKKAHAFRVTPAREEKQDEVEYKEHAGTFTLVVFRSAGDGDSEDAMVEKRDTAEEAVRQPASAGLPASLEVLQKRVKAGARERSESLVAKRGPSVGQGEAFSIRTKEFTGKWHPVPVYSLTVRYSKRAGE